MNSLLPLVSLLGVLVLVLTFNRGMFQRLGVGETIRLALIWAAIIMAGVLLVRMFGI
jgi:hypothetical protein